MDEEDSQSKAIAALRLVWDRIPKLRAKITRLVPQLLSETAKSQPRPTFDQMLDANAFDLMLLVPLDTWEMKIALWAMLEAGATDAASKIIDKYRPSAEEILKYDVVSPETSGETDLPEVLVYGRSSDEAILWLAKHFPPRSDVGRRFLQAAAESGRLELVKMLAEWWKLTLKDAEDAALAYAAAKSDDSGILRWMEEEGMGSFLDAEIFGYDIFAVAVGSGNIDAAEYISQKQDMKRDSFVSGALSVDVLSEALQSGSLKIVEWMLCNFDVPFRLLAGRWLSDNFESAIDDAIASDRNAEKVRNRRFLRSQILELLDRPIPPASACAKTQSGSSLE